MRRALESYPLESYPVDVDPAQVVRWVKAEIEAWPSAFRITAVRNREVRDIPARTEFHLGDDEREALSEIATFAVVEIAPGNAADGWLLRIVVEDEIGPRLSPGEAAGEPIGLSQGDDPADGSEGNDPADGGTDDTAELDTMLDLGAFYREFMRPGRGVATISAEVDGEPGRRRLATLLETIEKDGPHATRPATASAGGRRSIGAPPPLILRRGG